LLRDHLAQLIADSVSTLIAKGELPEAVRDTPVEISDTKQPEHGDYACNFAMTASKKAGMNPRQLGELLKTTIEQSSNPAASESPILNPGEAQSWQSPILSIDVAGPGFLNLRLNPAWIASFVPEVLKKGPTLPSPVAGRQSPQKINVEFVSVNPNGPITLGSGRGAAYGSTLCNILKAAGNEVHREYYINDGVNSEQMRLFAESVKSHFHGRPLPDNGYKGDYVIAVAQSVAKEHGKVATEDTNWFQQVSQDNMLRFQKSDLETFGVVFDTWFSEQSLHDKGEVAEEIEKMIASAVADERPERIKLKLARGGVVEEVEIEQQTGDAPEDDDTPNSQSSDPQSSNPASPTLWLRSTKFGDDMDRVLRRRDGRLTYIASDVAYHKDKFNRPPNADKLITILGPDHHGYIGRLQAVVAAMLKAEGRAPAPQTSSPSSPLTEIEEKLYTSQEERDTCQAALAEARKRLEVQIYQLVRFMKDGKPAPMRKRDGNIYALIDLIKEIGEKVAPKGSEEEKLTAGKDVARFFYLMRSHDSTFDFDLDLAEKQSDDNPVFYVQYAHARICSVIRKAEEAGLSVDPKSKIQNPKSFDASLLAHERELTLTKKICDLPFEVQRCAEDYGVHRLTTYAIELARTYHHFYDACRVVQVDQPELSKARLALCEATRVALKATLDLLGISAPERMEREAPEN